MRNHAFLSLFLLVTFLKGYNLNIVYDQVGSYAVSFTHVAIKPLDCKQDWPSKTTTSRSFNKWTTSFPIYRHH